MITLYRSSATKRIAADLGVEKLREAQKKALHSIYEGRDVLAIMPTAGGKSLLYQVPAIYEQRNQLGLTIVCSPLLALQRNQVEFLRKHDIPAVLLNSSLSQKERKKAFDNLNEFPLLYVTPEQLRSKDLRQALKSVRVLRVVIDEAHMLPQATPTFRPAYGEIGEFIQELSSPVQIMALTATATPEDRGYIINALGMENPEIFRSPIRRENLHLYVKRIAPLNGEGNMEARLTDNFAQAVTDELTEWNGKGRAIVYAPFKKRAKAIRKWLKASGFKGVGLYTGDCNDKKRHKAMKRFQSGEIRVMVATSAFGLGINFPNVRLVIHAGLPFSMDEYAQECGRGSRDGKKARCVLFFSDKDL